MKKLEIGCGERPTEGFLHQDVTSAEGVKLDFECLPHEIKDKDLVWTSSLIATDTGDGACELFRVSSIEWIEKVKG